MATNYWEENYQALGQSFQTDLLSMLTLEEKFSPTPYLDTANPPNATIGIGVNITLPQNMALVLQTLGAINAGQMIIQQETIVNKFEAVLKSIAGNPSLSLQNNLDALLQFYTGNPSASFLLTTTQANDLVTGVNSIVNGFTITASDGAYYAGTEAGYVNGQPNGDGAQLTAILNANGSPVPPNSREYLALMSLYYNGGSGLIGPNLRNVLATGNRAAAWYEIRYDSNGSGDFNTAKRRYYESTLFGLYSNPSSPALTEAFQAYQVLQEHRSTIMAYEDKWGLNPDGTAVPAIDTQYGQTALQSVMTDYSSILSQAGISTIPTLESMYNPAENTLFQEISAVFPEIASSLTVGNAFAPTNVFVGDSAPGTSNGPDNAISTLPFQTGIFQNAMPSLLLAGSGNDTLSASSGDSVLIAGAGNDVLNANAVSNTGTDTLIGGAGNDTLNGSSSGSDMFEYNPIVVGPNGTQAVAGGIETINDPTGEGTVWANSGSGVMQLVGGKPVAGTTNTWVDADGNQYQYSANTTGNTSLGTLTVTSSAGKEEIVLQNFNLDAAMSGAGELGIALGSPVALSAGPGATAGPFASGDYVADGVTTTAPGSVGQALTVSLSATSDTAQQVTVSLIASMKAKAAAMMLPALLLLWTPALAASPDFPFSYHFTLTKGTGIPVCEADLKRLNTATYSGPPGCDQPQTTSIPGFAPLHRVFLSSREVQILFPRVTQFMAFGKQGSKEQDEAFAAERKKLGLSPTWTLDEIKGYMRLGYIKVWRYDPPVDIDNDGRSTSLVIWQGVPISNAPGVCGKAAGMGGQDFYIQPQIAFVLAPGNNRLDTRKTKALFGHAGPRYRFPNGMVFRGFRPLGTAMGIFRYRGLYYFDTFFNGWGGSRTSSFAYYPALTDILGVFVHRNGKTAQVCEYHMTTRHINNAAGD